MNGWNKRGSHCCHFHFLLQNPAPGWVHQKSETVRMLVSIIELTGYLVLLLCLTPLSQLPQLGLEGEQSHFGCANTEHPSLSGTVASDQPQRTEPCLEWQTLLMFTIHPEEEQLHHTGCCSQGALFYLCFKAPHPQSSGWIPGGTDDYFEVYFATESRQKVCLCVTLFVNHFWNRSIMFNKDILCVYEWFPPQEQQRLFLQLCLLSLHMLKMDCNWTEALCKSLTWESDYRTELSGIAVGGCISI